MPVRLMVLSNQHHASEVDGCVVVEFDEGYSPQDFDEGNDLDFEFQTTEETIEIPVVRAVVKEDRRWR